MSTRRFVIKAIDQRYGIVLIEAETGNEYLCKGKRAQIGAISRNGKKKKIKQPDIWGPNPDYKPERKKRKKAENQTKTTSKQKKDTKTEKETPMSRTRSEMKEMADALGLDFLQEGDFMVAADPSTQMNQKLEDYSRMVEDDVPEKELKAEEQKIRAFYREHGGQFDEKAKRNFSWMFPGKAMRVYGEGTYRLEQKILAEADRDHD